MQRNKKINKRRPKSNKKGRKPLQDQSLYRGLGRDQLVLPKRFRIMPPSLVTKLVFMSTLHSPLNNAGSTFASVRFRPSSAFDVDPVIGGTSMPGFNELAGIYGRYRMIRFKMDAIVVNNEDFPLNVNAFVSNFDLGANYSQVQSQFGNSFERHKYLSARGGMDRATLRTPYWSAADVVGSDSPLLSDSFSATISSSPVNNTYINLGIWTGNSTALVNGVNCQIVITGEYRFYEIFHLVTKPDPPQMHPELLFQMLPDSVKSGKNLK